MPWEYRDRRAHGPDLRSPAQFGVRTGNSRASAPDVKVLAGERLRGHCPAYASIGHAFKRDLALEGLRGALGRPHAGGSGPIALQPAERGVAVSEDQRFNAELSQIRCRKVRNLNAIRIGRHEHGAAGR